MPEVSLHRRAGGSANQATTIHASPDPTSGHCYAYRFQARPLQLDDGKLTPEVFADIRFQEGLPSEVGINGVTDEALIAILVDRLRRFQAGAFACRQNAVAITKLEEALHWLGDRTADRVERQVEGTYEL